MKWNSKISENNFFFHFKSSLSNGSIAYIYHYFILWLAFTLQFKFDLPPTFCPLLYVTYLTLATKSSEVLLKSFVIPSPWLWSWFTAPMPSFRE